MTMPLRLPLFLCLALACAGAAFAQGSARTPLGVFEGWGAFRDAAAGRCYAIAAPDATIGTPAGAAYASVGNWPRQGLRGQFYVRLSKPRAARSALRLTIGSRRFILVGNGVHGWASDARMDAAIVAAMRANPSMSVEAVTPNGNAIADTYRLRGAATAIDAAALGCARLQ